MVVLTKTTPRRFQVPDQTRLFSVDTRAPAQPTRVWQRCGARDEGTGRQQRARVQQRGNPTLGGLYGGAFALATHVGLRARCLLNHRAGA